MDRTTRTLNPLHFEDLEAHRFEDLVRQLIYDFRAWRSIEPTGRLGSDEGMDIRATEATLEDQEEPQDETEEAPPPRVTERVWIIQCKREKSITPKMMPTIVSEAIPDGSDVPHGFILAAACDFSKKTRDVFRAEMVARRLEEYFLWGKADLEDMLYRPENDHLLFAYFGISLVVRRRTIRSRIRSTLVMKRKAVSALGDVRDSHQTEVLLRDASDTHYPNREEISDFDEYPRWIHRFFVRHHPNGLLILVGKYFAYVANDGEQWDMVGYFNDAYPPQSPVPWADLRRHSGRHAERNTIWKFWYDLALGNRGTYHWERLIRYENIVDIDKDGDALSPQVPHIFVEFKGTNGPFEAGGWAHIERPAHFDSIPPIEDKRITFFPDPIPEVKDPGPPT